MRQSSRIVWLGYASIALSIVWGAGVLPAWYALRLARRMTDDQLSHRPTRRDVRGGKLLATVGMTLSIIVVLAVLWSLISTAIWLP